MLLFVLLVLWTLAFTFGLVRAVASEIPSLDPAAQRSEVDTVVYASNGRTVLAVLRGNESRVLVDTEDIAPIMRHAIVSVEDKRFFEHDGIDMRGVLRALWADIRNRAIVEGGSTITQQFVKNAYIRNERSFARKVREAALAWQLEEQWQDKDRILTAYLNTIYFGNGAYGIQQASRAYFKKGAKYLELHEAALLAGLPADPARYDPVTSPRSAKERRRHVLGLMLEQGKITKADYEHANRAPLPRPEDVRLPGTGGKAQYFVNYVKDQLVDQYGAGKVFGGGLRVTTTIDLELQDRARGAIEKVLKDPDLPPRRSSRSTRRLVPSRRCSAGATSARASSTSPRRPSGSPARRSSRSCSPRRCARGSRLRPRSSRARCRSTRAIASGASRTTTRRTSARVSLDRALVRSDNSVYAQLTDLVGPAAIARTAHDLGIQSPLDPYFSIGLGLAAEVNPLEMARAYATIANEGRRVDGSIFGDRPRVVDRVVRIKSGRVDANEPRPTQVLEPGEANVLTDIMSDVVRLGTGRRASIPGMHVAGKTGTTDNYADAWFVGYTPELVVAVWVGYPDRLRPMLTEFDGEPVTGGTLPALIWKEFVSSVEELDEDATFDYPPYLGAVPTWVVKRGGEFRLDNGYCRGSRLLAYFSGKGPSRTADCKPNEVQVPLVVGQTEESAVARLAAQPLEATLAYVPAKAGRRPAIVVNQEPKAGGLSAGDSVKLWVTKSRHGLVPNFVGSTLGDTSREVKRLKLRPRVVSAPGPAGMVLRQTPEPGVTAAPGLRIRLVVGDGSQKSNS